MNTRTRPTGSTRQGMKRRDFLLDSIKLGGLGLSALTWPNLLAANTLTPPVDDVVRIGYLPIADATALLIADANGYFTDEGLQVAPPTKVGSWTELVRGFFTRQYNVVHLLKPISVWMRYHFDIPIKVMAWAHINGSAVIAGAHLQARSFADLGGKQVAVPYWFSMHNMVLQMALRHVGLTPVIRPRHEPLADHEVNLCLLPPQLMVWALEARNIDAYIVAEPLNSAGELQAGARVLRFTGDMWRNHPCCVVCMDERDVNARPDWTQKVMNAIVRAQVFAQENKVETAHILSAAGKAYIPVPDNLMQRAFTNYANQPEYLQNQAIQHPEWGSGRIDFAPWPYPSATRMLVENMPHTLIGHTEQHFLQDLDPDFVVNDLVNYEFVRNAMQQHGNGDVLAGLAGNDPFAREEVIAL